MKFFLDDFVKTLSPVSGARAADLLAIAKLNKDQYGRIKSQLSSSLAFGKLQIPKIRTGDIVTGGAMSSVFRDIDLSVSEFFRRSNSISALLDSTLGVLTADIKVMEDELAALEKAADNYGFLLADNASFDYAFLEGFNDERGRDIELPSLSDRSNPDFKIEEQAYIDSFSGTLIMNSASQNRWPISTVQLFKNNVSVFLNENDIITLDNIGRPRIDNGWKVSIDSPAPIKGRMEGYEENTSGNITGPQFVLDFYMVNPAPSNTITVVPFSEWDFLLSEVRIYEGSDDSVYQTVWDTPTKVVSPINISFPNTLVSRFRFYIRQPTYRRQISRAIGGEDTNRKVFNEMAKKSILPNRKIKTKTPDVAAVAASSYSWWDQRMLLYLNDKIRKRDKSDTPFSSSLPRVTFNKRWGAFSNRSHTLKNQSFTNMREVWENEDWAMRLINDVVRSISSTEAIWNTELNSNKQFKPAHMPAPLRIRSNPEPYNDPMGQSLKAERQPRRGEGHFTLPYVYKIGLRNVFIGLSAHSDRSVFVSNRLDAPGTIGTIRLKSDFTNKKVTDTDRDSDRITSIEYSVTNISRPIKEQDWTPAMPIGVESVEAERLYPDTAGFCKFRFTARIDAPINIYINGYHKKEYEINRIARRKETINGFAYDAITIPTTDYSSGDILTVNYTPSHDFSTIKFPELDPSKSPPLISAYDNDGAGEGFVDSNNQLVISLAHNPFIDYQQVATATYNTTTGLNGYAPITIRFSDGTTAYNLTNYKSGTQTDLDSSNSSVQYIQSGNSIRFNKVVASDFRAYYQYQPSDLRVRIVFRNNYDQFVSPYVDYYQIKAQTKKADAKRSL